MSYNKIKTTFDKKLKAFFTSGDAGDVSIVFYENTEIKTSASATFLSSYLLMAEPTAAGCGTDAPNKQTGLYQVNVNTPFNVGSGPALVIADAVAEEFKRGTKLDAGDFEITIKKVFVSKSIKDNTHYTIPVTIQFYAYTSN